MNSLRNCAPPLLKSYFAEVWTSSRKDPGSLGRSIGFTSAGKIGAGPFSFSSAVPASLNKSSRNLTASSRFGAFFIIVMPQATCSAGTEMVRALRAVPRPGQNHNRVLPVIRILRSGLAKEHAKRGDSGSTRIAHNPRPLLQNIGTLATPQNLTAETRGSGDPFRRCGPRPGYSPDRCTPSVPRWAEG